jgi:sugar O-acyltransferase (sialic acid O-acetyltransferase NeuD family)
MADIVLFGIGDYAQQAHYYLSNDSEHRVVAFTVSASYCKSDEFLGLPLVPFEDVERRFPPEDFSMFLPMSGRRMNRLRADFVAEARAKSYPLISYVSSRAMLNANAVGENCFILENTNIQPFATIGDNTVIWCNTHIGHHSTVGSDVFISSGVVVSGRCSIGPNSYLSANSVVDANVTLGQGTLLGIGSVISRRTEPWGIYTGSPARRRRISSADYEFL